MRYAITSTGCQQTSDMDMRFGRCSCLVFYDTESGSVEFLPNPYRELDDEVGPRLVELVAERGIQRIVSGSFGFKIKPLLDSKKIQMIIPNEPGITVGKIIRIIGNSAVQAR